jgi:excinuclease ABC subunit B
MADLSVTAAEPAPASAEGSFVSYPDSPFQLFRPYLPAGDQPTAIEGLVGGVRDGLSFQTLLGVTGSGKTFRLATGNSQLGRPAIECATI